MNIFFISVMLISLFLCAIHLGGLVESKNPRQNIGRLVLFFGFLLFGIGGWVWYDSQELIEHTYYNETTGHIVLSEIFDETTGIETTVRKKTIKCVITKEMNNPYGMFDSDDIEYEYLDMGCKEALKEHNER